MARTNYQYEKRQRDLAKKKKKEEKRLKKLNRALGIVEGEENSENPETEATDDEATDDETTESDSEESTEKSSDEPVKIIQEDI